ncbi:MAG: DUF5343 domain-containing protein [Myxococcota bacterium]
MAKHAAGHTKPLFPYTTTPGVLRKFLAEVPKRPKPAKVNLETIKSWGLSKDSNAQTVVSVLKALGLIAGDGTPGPLYVKFMTQGTGPGVLGQQIRSVYKTLFENSKAPHKDSDEAIRNLFNIHSGGSATTIGLQIQTLKALCDHASFEDSQSDGESHGDPKEKDSERDDNRGPTIHIDLHIHLPENKDRRDYEYIFEDIAKHLMGRSPGSGKSND